LILKFVRLARRSDAPVFRFLRSLAKRVRTSNLPVPRFLNPLLLPFFYLPMTVRRVSSFLFSYFIRVPLFRARCASMGRNFRLFRMPWVVGHAEIHIGNDVSFFGKVDIGSGSVFDRPRLILGDRVDIGHGVGFTVNKEIVIEEDVNVANHVHFRDTDAHPRDAAARVADERPPADEVRPVRVCRRAWIGGNVYVMKGVTIGEGAIIGVNSVVVTDIPPYCVAMGNPARVVVKGQKPPDAA
jgi:acetyltransferase-like isoleucine patch superfamily enzyme